MEQVLAVLPFLAFLVCPLMMAFCLFGMCKPGSAAPSPTVTQTTFQRPEERVAALQSQLQAIQSELTALQPTPAPLPDSGMDRLAEIVPGAVHATRRPA